MEILTDSEAKMLMELEKIVRGNRMDIPCSGAKEQYDLWAKLRSSLYDNIMKIHITSSNKNHNKYSFNVVYNKSITIFRVDIGGSKIHINPDGEEIPLPHLHIYREGYDARYAIPLPNSFSNPDNICQVLYDLLGFSNVINRDKVEITHQGVLFNGRSEY